jgi:arginase
MLNRVSLIGAPSDIGAGTRGASMGPEALRVAQIQAMLESQGLDVCDRGDLRGPSNPLRGPVDGYRHLEEVRNGIVRCTMLSTANWPIHACPYCSEAIIV